MRAQDVQETSVRDACHAKALSLYAPLLGRLTTPDFGVLMFSTAFEQRLRSCVALAIETLGCDM